MSEREIITAYDFDDVLSKRGLLCQRLREIFEATSMDDHIWFESLKAASNAGYSPESHLALLIARGHRHVQSTSKIQRDVSTLFEAESFLFEDVIPRLQLGRERRERQIIITFGYAPWQHRKLHASGIQKLVDEVIITEGRGQKAQILLSRFGESQRLTFVDDDPDELDKLRALMPDAVTWRMNRVPPEAMLDDSPLTPLWHGARMNALRPSRFPHRLCTTVREVE